MIHFKYLLFCFAVVSAVAFFLVTGSVALASDYVFLDTGNYSQTLGTVGSWGFSPAFQAFVASSTASFSGITFRYKNYSETTGQELAFRLFYPTIQAGNCAGGGWTRWNGGCGLTMIKEVLFPATTQGQWATTTLMFTEPVVLMTNSRYVFAVANTSYETTKRIDMRDGYKYPGSPYPGNGNGIWQQSAWPTMGFSTTNDLVFTLYGDEQFETDGLPDTTIAPYFDAPASQICYADSQQCRFEYNFNKSAVGSRLYIAPGEINGSITSQYCTTLYAIASTTLTATDYQGKGEYRGYFNLATTTRPSITHYCLFIGNERKTGYQYDFSTAVLTDIWSDIFATSSCADLVPPSSCTFCWEQMAYAGECAGRKLSWWLFTPSNYVTDKLETTLAKTTRVFPVNIGYQFVNPLTNVVASTTQIGIPGFEMFGGGTNIVSPDALQNSDRPDLVYWYFKIIRSIIWLLFIWVIFREIFPSEPTISI